MKDKIRFAGRFIESILAVDDRRKLQNVARIKQEVEKIQFRISQIRKQIDRYNLDSISLESLETRISLTSNIILGDAQRLTNIKFPAKTKLNYRSVIEELSAIFASYPGTTFEKGFLIIPIEDISIDDGDQEVFLGTVAIKIYPGNILDCEIIPIKGTTTNRDGFFHPHVNHNGSLCLGDGKDIAAVAVSEGRLEDYVSILESVLRSYGSPFSELRVWYSDGPQCESCDAEIGEDEAWECNGCGRIICENCARSCNECRTYYCYECLTECECGRFYCSDDAHVCSECGVKCCERCYGTMCCDCGIILCEDCVESNAKECSTCGRTMCSECAGTCHECGATICGSCTSQCCEDCGRKLCKKHDHIKCFFSD